MKALIERRNAAERRADARLAVAVAWIRAAWMSKEESARLRLADIYPSLEDSD